MRPRPSRPRRRDADRRPAAARRRRRVLQAAAGAVALALLAIGLWRISRPAALREPAPERPDPIALMRPSDAYRTALALAHQGRNQESLPYFRRAIAGVGEDFWELHYNYSSALYDLTREFRSLRGRQVARLRSTWEQIQTMRVAMSEMNLAERLAPDPRALAAIKARRAQMTDVWGFPWDTFVAYRQGYTLDSGRSELADRGDRLMELMRAPDRVARR